MCIVSKFKKSFNIFKQKRQIKKFLNIIDEVEYTSIQLYLGNITYKQLEEEDDSIYGNKSNRFEWFRKNTEEFLCDFLEISKKINGLEELIQYIFIFRKQYIYKNCRVDDISEF